MALLTDLRGSLTQKMRGRYFLSAKIRMKFLLTHANDSDVS